MLTFGDKPAPAMAQIASRKTAELNKDEYSEAAEVLTSNVYMDDICESVDTVKEAQTLTKEMDEVLKIGGFSVKGWISNKMLTGVKPDTEKRKSVCEGEVKKSPGNHLELQDKQVPLRSQSKSA